MPREGQNTTEQESLKMAETLWDGFVYVCVCVCVCVCIYI